MRLTTKKYRGIVMTIGLLVATAGHAFDMGNMMNPSKWMGGKNDRNDDYYDDRGYGYPGGGPGYGYGGPYGGAPGYGYGAPGYGSPGYGSPGYGAPGYGAPGYGSPGYGAGAAPAYPAAPAAANDATAEEIERLKDRIRVLENTASQPAASPPPATAAPSWDRQPAYRPADETWGDPSTYQYR
jgi:hypothetical protein